MLIDLRSVYNTYFQPPYKVNDQREPAEIPNYGGLEKLDASRITGKGDSIWGATRDVFGREIFLPVEFWLNNQQYLVLNCCTVRIVAKKTIVRTAVAERSGTVKEQFNLQDYSYTIKGVLIGETGFPDAGITKLIDLHKSTETVEMHNAMTSLFMDKSKRVAIETLEFPDQQGKGIRHRPFVITCETDFVEDLIIKDVT